MTGGRVDPGGGLMGVDGHVYAAGRGSGTDLPVTIISELVVFNPAKTH